MPKPVTDPFVLHVCELLAVLGGCQARRLFGGWGLSVDGMTVGIIAWDTLFLKTHTTTEHAFVQAGGRPFEYAAKGRTTRLHYHTPPAEALESPALMAPWARLALEAALAARQKPAPRRRRAGRAGR